MTRNLYLGADLSPALNATSSNEFIDANGQIVRDVDTNDFPTRAKGLAQEILRRRPHVVGLQEVALWRYGPVNDGAPFSCNGGPDDDPPYGCNFTASTVRYDYLRALMQGAQRGQAAATGWWSPSRSSTSRRQPTTTASPATATRPGANDNGEENDRLTMRDVILARVGDRRADDEGEDGTLRHPVRAGDRRAWSPCTSFAAGPGST